MPGQDRLLGPTVASLISWLHQLRIASVWLSCGFSLWYIGVNYSWFIGQFSLSSSLVWLELQHGWSATTQRIAVDQLQNQLFSLRPRLIRACGERGTLASFTLPHARPRWALACGEQGTPASATRANQLTSQVSIVVQTPQPLTVASRKCLFYFVMITLGRAVG